MRRTMVVSVFAGCGKTWLANHQNKYGYSMRDSDSSTYVKVLNGNTNQTEICDMLDKAEAQMPEDKFMQFFNKYDNPNIWDIN